MKRFGAREGVLLSLLIIGLAVAALLEPRFVTLRTQALLSTHLWELAIVAIPMLLIIMSGGIDLSVGAIVALCGVSVGLTFERGFSPFLGVGIGIIVGALAGSINGWLIARLKVHPLIVTLATMALFRGIAEGISLARPISGYPPAFQNISQGKWLGIPYPAFVFVTLALIAYLVISKARFGRWVVALGTEERATRFSGIPVERLHVWLYAACGLVCGIAAVLLVARNNTAKADMGMGLELEAITAVVLGGTSIEGGRGRLLGILLSLAIIHLAREFVTWHWKQSELNMIVMGGLLIGALLIERMFSRLPQRGRSPAGTQTAEAE